MVLYILQISFSKQEASELLKGSTKEIIIVLFLQPSPISDSLKIILNGFMPVGGYGEGGSQKQA